MNSHARPASTVLLLREGLRGIEVLMVTRNVESDFASGALVFPGGRVDAVDGDAPELAFRVAAIRETFEEARILLARARGAASLLTAREIEALEKRLALELDRPPLFADLVASGAIELATDLLVPFAHWITPEGRPKRYDTHFFLAVAPLDQMAAHDGYEAVDSVWIRPQDAVASADAGKVSLVFATRMNLLKLDRQRTIEAVLATARLERIVTVCPELVEKPDGLWLRIPREAGYGIEEISATGLARA
ncbi:MAG TPA: NUDIX domain-containing protein [Stellaceae bacterium]|nr:NUDIX domain-containing protein [Stellaceae bacterium]